MCNKMFGVGFMSTFVLFYQYFIGAQKLKGFDLLPCAEDGNGALWVSVNSMLLIFYWGFQGHNKFSECFQGDCSQDQGEQLEATH